MLAGSPPALVDGYLLTGEARAPERIPLDLLRRLDDLSLSDFVIADRAQLERYKKGVERLTIAASPTPISATRYEQQKGDHTIIYWLSDAVRPIGLVRLESRGEKPQHNYALELTSLLKNVGRKIDPQKAVPLSAEGRAILATPLR